MLTQQNRKFQYSIYCNLSFSTPTYRTY